MKVQQVDPKYFEQRTYVIEGECRNNEHLPFYLELHLSDADRRKLREALKD